MPEIEIIEEKTTGLLAEKINQRLREGYQLHGSPFALPTAKPITLGAGTALPMEVAGLVCQMMVKPNKP
jgi:hypothetical protein